MKRIFITALLPALLLASCNSWLDIQPELEIRKDQMYKTEKGFKDVLTGVYIRMARPALYGRNTSIMLPELLVRHWQVYGSNAETYLTGHDYYSTNARSAVDAYLDQIWSEYYTAIVNLNSILGEIDNKKDMFTNGNYELIKGEALGLRAFLHFELLRYWGACPADIMMTDIAIPYVVDITEKPERLVSVSYAEVLAGILNDLDRAEALLVSDPLVRLSVQSLNRPGEIVSLEGLPADDFHYYRQFRFNYYAVLAVKARYYMWLGETAEAAGYADRVIEAVNQSNNARKFTFATMQTDQAIDLTFPTEGIFMLNNSRAQATLPDLFVRYNSSPPFLTQDMDLLETAYESGEHPFDIRFRNNRMWEVRDVQSYNSIDMVRVNFFKKYIRNETIAREDIPIIRLAEMYFISIEAGNTGIFRDYRAARGLDSSLDGTLTDQDAVRKRLESEYRKDFYGEGQLFFYYKRLKYGQISWPEPYRMDASTYGLPKPQSQTVYE